MKKILLLFLSLLILAAPAFALEKNTASQKWVVFCFDDTDNSAKTGDAAQITANVRIDGAAADAVDDANPTELEDGYYIFDITAAESNGENIVICPDSSTADIQCVGCPMALYTRPPNHSDMDIDATNGQVDSNLTHIGGVAQSATDLKDFADAGYDPATDKVQGVVLTDTTTTNSDLVSAAAVVNEWETQSQADPTGFHVNILEIGGTAQTANDNGADINTILTDTAAQDTSTELRTLLTGADTAVSTVTTAQVNTEVDNSIITYNLDHWLLTATVAADMTAEVADNTILSRILANGDTSAFDPTSDGLQLIRDRGDAAWTTGAGGSDRLLMVDTTIATLATQTSFTLTAGSADDNAYNNCTIVIEDVSAATQKAVGLVSDYTGGTKTITLKYDPGIFTMATTDKIYILAENALKSTLANRQLNVAADGDIAGNVDGSVASVAGNVGGNVTGSIGSLAAQAKLDVNAEADTAVSDYDPPTNAEMEARTIVTANYFDPSSDAVANVTLVATTTTNSDMRGTDSANTTVPDAAGTLATYDPPTKTEMDTAFTEIKGATFSTDTDQLEDLRDRGDSAWITAVGFSTHTANNVRDAVFAEAVEGALTFEEIVRIILAKNAGETTGAGTATITFRDQADTKNRISATITSGNRTAMTLDGS